LLACANHNLAKIGFTQRRRVPRNLPSHIRYHFSGGAGTR
jgi:hypothetical protein